MVSVHPDQALGGDFAAVGGNHLDSAGPYDQRAALIIIVGVLNEGVLDFIDDTGHLTRLDVDFGFAEPSMVSGYDVVERSEAGQLTRFSSGDRSSAFVAGFVLSPARFV